MDKEVNQHVGVSVKFPTLPRKDKTLMTAHEFEELLRLSGEANRSRLIHLALHHYRDVVRQQLVEQQETLGKRIAEFDATFPLDKEPS
jgi:hypothetical protein